MCKKNANGNKGKVRYLDSMPEDSGYRYKIPAFSLSLRSMCWLEKPENLSYLAQLLFELSQKN